MGGRLFKARCAPKKMEWKADETYFLMEGPSDHVSQLGRIGPCLSPNSSNYIKIPLVGIGTTLNLSWGFTVILAVRFSIWDKMSILSPSSQELTSYRHEKTDSYHCTCGCTWLLSRLFAVKAMNPVFNYVSDCFKLLTFSS